MTKKTIAALAVAATCSLALAGCSDDADSKASDAQASDKPAKSDAPAESTTTELTKAELIEQGDAICQASNDRSQAAADAIDWDSDDDDTFINYILDTVVPEVARTAEELRELTPPAEDAETIDAMISALEAEVAKVEADPDYALSEDSSFSEANQIAQDYGFEVCGEE